VSLLARLQKFLAFALFFITDLRVKEAADDRAKRERSCKPKAKTQHCDGA